MDCAKKDKFPNIKKSVHFGASTSTIVRGSLIYMLFFHLLRKLTADSKTKIPMLGKTESLNAGIATGVILYEYVRRKVSKN